MISANGSLPAHRYTPQVTQRWPWGSEPASFVEDVHRVDCPTSKISPKQGEFVRFPFMPKQHMYNHGK